MLIMDSTTKVSENIIEASLMALSDAMNYKLFKSHMQKEKYNGIGIIK